MISVIFFPKGVLPNIKFRVPIIVSSPFLEFCVEGYHIWLFSSDSPFSNANKINKNVNTKTFVIAPFLKLCIICQKCKGANIFDHDCTCMHIHTQTYTHYTNTHCCSPEVVSLSLRAHYIILLVESVLFGVFVMVIFYDQVPTVLSC